MDLMRLIVVSHGPEQDKLLGLWAFFFQIQFSFQDYFIS